LASLASMASGVAGRFQMGMVAAFKDAIGCAAVRSLPSFPDRSVNRPN